MTNTDCHTTCLTRYANPFNRRVWDALPPHASLPYAWDQVRWLLLSALTTCNCWTRTHQPSPFSTSQLH